MDIIGGNMSYQETKKKLYQQIGVTPGGSQGDSAGSSASTGASSYESVRSSLYKGIGMKPPTRSSKKDYSTADFETARSRASTWERQFLALGKDISVNGYTEDNRKRFEYLQSSYLDIANGLDGEDIKRFAELGKRMTSLRNYVNRQTGSSVQKSDSQVSESDAQSDAQRDYEEKKNLDIPSYERELSALEKELEDYDPDIDWTDTNARKQVSQEIEDRKAEISRRKQYLNQAKQIQKNAQLSSVADPNSSGYDKDFSSLSKYGFGSDDRQYEYINNQNGMRDRIKEENRAYGSSKFAETEFEEKGYDYLTEDEVAVYNYYYARDGKEKAQEYLDTMQEELNRRKAGAYYQNMAGNTPMELAFGFAAGLDQFSSGVKSLFNTEDDYIPYSAKQIASGMAREDLADVGVKLPDWLGGASLGQIGYDAITTTTNMAPSILASMAVGIVNPIAGEIVGTGLMGASAAGNAYQEMLNSGYDKKQARTYSALVGASEAGLQYLLGGIGKLGGKVSGNAVKRMIDGIDSAFIRAAVNFGGNMASEGLEEGLQEILTPWFQNLVLYADEDVNWSEVAYSSLLGALTAGVMEGPKGVYQAVNTYRSGKRNVPDAAAGTNPGSPVDKTVEKGGTVYGGVPENEAGTQDSVVPEKSYTVSQNKDRGTTEITFTQKPSKEVQAVLKENGFKWSKKGKLWYGSQSTEQAESIVQKAIGFSDAAPARSEPADSAATPAGMKSEVVETDSSAPGSESVGAVNDPVPDDKPFDVSWVEGKTLLNREDGSTVETHITGIASNERGKLMLNVAGQSAPVSADKISYADSGDAILYQAINSMEIKPRAASEFVSLASQMGAKKGEFASEIKNMYTLGELGVPFDKAKKSGYADHISSVMQEFGWELGRRVYNTQVQKAESNKKANASAQRASASTDGQNVNGVQYDGLAAKRGSSGFVEIEGVNLNEQQKAGIRAAEMLAQIGVNIHVFQSQTDSSGNPMGENGSYSTRDGSIHIDLNAGNMGQGVMAYTLSHEFTHFMEQQSPAMFQTFTDSLFAELDTDIEAEIASKVEELKKQRPEQYKDADQKVLMQDARSEVVAEACETMLTDTDAAQRIAQRIQEQDSTLWQKVVQWFRDLGDKLRKAYHGFSPDSDIAREAKKTIQQVDSLVKMWADMAVSSAENYRTAGTDMKKAAGSGGVKMQSRDGGDSNPYSYESFVSKPDMAVTVVSGKVPNNRADVVYYAKQNAAKIGKFNTKDGSVSVHVKDIDTDVLLTTAGLRHGLDRRFNVNAPVTLKIGEILQNSIRINEMNPSRESASGSYALIGAAATEDGQMYVVRSVVNRFSNEVSSVDVLYAVNSKSDANKKMNRVGDNPQGSRHDSRFLTGSTISISELLDYVNEYFPDILPEDVLKYYGHEARPAGKLGESALYSERGGQTENHQEELAMTREKMAQDAQTERENMIRNYQESRGVFLQNWRRTEVDVLRKAAESTESLDLSEKELNSLGIFREKLEKLDSLQAKYEKIRDKEGMLSAGDLDAISRYQKQMEAIHNKLWEYSQYPILKSVSQKAREILLEQYGTIPAGENAVRAAELPAKTNKMNRVSKTVATAIEAGVTTDAVAEQIQQKAVEGEYSYLPITDESAKQRADETIRRKGWDNALMDWRVDMRKSSFPGKDMVTLGFQLYNNAVNAGDTKTALNILTDITNTVRNSAQVVQAVRILKQLSPDDRLYAIQRQLDTIQDDLNKRYGEKAPQIDMNSALAENYRNARGEEAIRAAEDALFRDIAAKLPNTFADKWNSWRYLSMLGNLRTHIRNVLGNVGFAPVRSAKDWIAYGIEAGANAISPDGIARTKGKLFAHSESDRALYSAGLMDYDTAESLIGSANLKSGDALSRIEQMRPAFGSDNAVWRTLSKVAEMNSNSLSSEDMIFKKTTYAAAYGGYMKANGITADMIQTGDVSSSVLDEARVYAFNEALKATYNDFNDFSNFVAKLGNLRNSENKAVKTAGILVEGVLPFKRTPANIVARSVEYSPVGMINGIKKCLFDVRRGNATAAEAIDSVASGLTGTILLGFGALLANMGILSGGDGEDDKQRQFDKLRGEQSYALKAFGKSYTIDWLAPEVIPMFIGVELYNRVNSSGGLRFRDILESVARVSNPLLEMSCLSSLNDLLDSISYSDNKLYSIFSQAAASYVLQALPTVFGQIERIGEPDREQTYLSNDSRLPKDMQQTIAKAANKIPGVEYRQIPYIDAYGRRQETGGIGTRIFRNVLSPGYSGTDRSAPWDDELQRLYDLGYASVLPPTAAKKIGDKELSAEEYVQYATFTGQERYRLLGEVTQSEYFTQSSDADKEAILQDLYAYVNAEGSKKMLPDREVAKWTEKGMEMEEIGVPFVEFLRMKNMAVNKDGNFTKDACVSYIKKNFPASKRKAVWDIMKNPSWKNAW